jgi:hypothetical protein
MEVKYTNRLTGAMSHLKQPYADAPRHTSLSKASVWPDGSSAPTGKMSLDIRSIQNHPPRGPFSRAAEDDPHSRPKRGGVLGKCGAGSDFRECRGGDALKENASDFVKFDQIDYKRTRNGADGKGSCEGIVREAIRRIDRNDSTDLMDAVTYMRSDANVGGESARDMFDRIDNYQGNPGAFVPSRFVRDTTIRLDRDRSLDRTARLNHLDGAVQRSLNSPGNLAVVRFGLYDNNSNAAGFQAGHAILIQRGNDDRITIFCPNNAAYRYPNAQEARRALHAYIDTAFSETGYTVVPDSVEPFRAYAMPQSKTNTTPLPDVVPPEPPLKQFPGFHSEL